MHGPQAVSRHPSRKRRIIPWRASLEARRCRVLAEERQDALRDVATRAEASPLSHDPARRRLYYGIGPQVEVPIKDMTLPTALRCVDRDGASRDVTGP
jgi:hypothetical protein